MSRSTRVSDTSSKPADCRTALVVSASAIENGPGPQVGSSDSSLRSRNPDTTSSARCSQSLSSLRRQTTSAQAPAGRERERGRCAAPPRGWRRTSCPCARRRSRRARRTRSPERPRRGSSCCRAPASLRLGAGHLDEALAPRRSPPPRRRVRPARPAAGPCRRTRSPRRARARRGSAGTAPGRARRVPRGRWSPGRGRPRSGRRDGPFQASTASSFDGATGALESMERMLSARGAAAAPGARPAARVGPGRWSRPRLPSA